MTRIIITTSQFNSVLIAMVHIASVAFYWRRIRQPKAERTMVSRAGMEKYIAKNPS